MGIDMTSSTTPVIVPDLALQDTTAPKARLRPRPLPVERMVRMSCVQVKVQLHKKSIVDIIAKVRHINKCVNPGIIVNTASERRVKQASMVNSRGRSRPRVRGCVQRDTFVHARRSFPFPVRVCRRILNDIYISLFKTM